MGVHGYRFVVGLAAGLFLSSAWGAEARVEDSTRLANTQKVPVLLKLTTRSGAALTLTESDKKQEALWTVQVSEALSKNGFEVLASEGVSGTAAYPVVSVSVLSFNRLELPSDLLYFDVAIQLVNRDSPGGLEKKQAARPMYRHVSGVVAKDAYVKRVGAEMKSLVKGFTNEYFRSGGISGEKRIP